MAYGAGEANMAAAWEQYLQNHNVNHQLQLQDILRETEPPTESKKKEGSGKRKTKRNRTILPRLRKVSYKNKKHRYRLKDPFRKRKKAIHEGVKMEAEMKGRSIKKAAIAKKGRFNVLRIYRRNKKIRINIFRGVQHSRSKKMAEKLCVYAEMGGYAYSSRTIEEKFLP